MACRVTENLINGVAAVQYRGTIVHLNTTARTFFPASSGSVVEAQGVVGTVFSVTHGGLATGPIVTNGEGYVLMADVAKPAVGAFLWLATVSGAATVNKPVDNVVFIGVVKDTTDWVAVTNQVVVADITPMPDFDSATNELVTNAYPALGTNFIKGGVVRIDPASTSSTAPGAFLAQADNPNNSQGTVGVVLEAMFPGEIGPVTTNGRALVKMDSVSVAKPGDFLWISDFELGKATNIQPTNAYYLGVVKYTGNPAGAGELVIADVSPMPSSTLGNVATADLYYAVDYDNGLDTNKGWGITAQAAALVPKKTWDGLLKILPKNGNNFDATIYVAQRSLTGAGNTPNYYPSGTCTLKLPGVFGYDHIYIQGAPRAFAGPFTGTAAQMTEAGAFSSALGTRTAAGGTPWTFQDNGGAVYAVNEFVGWRIRVLNANDATMNGGSATIYSNTVDTITFARKIVKPDGSTVATYWTPIAGDTVVIERPGVIFERVTLDLTPAQDLYLNGIGARTSFNVSNNEGTVHTAFCAGWGMEQAEANPNGCDVGFTSIRDLYMTEWTVINSDSVTADRRDLGNGFFRRSPGTNYLGANTDDTHGTDFVQIDLIAASEVVLIQGGTHTELHLYEITMGRGPSQPSGWTDNVGLFAGSRLVGGTYIRQAFLGNEAPLITTPGSSRTTIGADEAGIDFVPEGYYQNTWFSRNYVAGMAGFGTLRVRDASPWFDGVQMSDLAATGAGNINTGGFTLQATGANMGLKRVKISGVVAAANAPSIDLGRCAGCTFVYDPATLLITGGLVRDFDMPGSVSGDDVWVQKDELKYMRTFVDLANNTYFNIATSTANVVPGIVRAAMVVSTDGVVVPAHRVVHLTSIAGNYTLVKATNASAEANIQSTLGVLVNAISNTGLTINGPRGYIVTSGPAIVYCDDGGGGGYTPTGSIASSTLYCSDATDGAACIYADLDGGGVNDFVVGLGILLYTTFGGQLYPVLLNGVGFGQGNKLLAVQKP